MALDPRSVGPLAGSLGRAPALRQRPARPSWSRSHRPANPQLAYERVLLLATRALLLPAPSFAVREWLRAWTGLLFRHGRAFRFAPQCPSLMATGSTSPR